MDLFWGSATAIKIISIIGGKIAKKTVTKIAAKSTFKNGLQKQQQHPSAAAGQEPPMVGPFLGFGILVSSLVGQLTRWALGFGKPDWPATLLKAFGLKYYEIRRWISKKEIPTMD